VRNREHLASWDPRRDESFFTERGQRQDVEARLTATGRGLAGAAVGFAVESADALGLHRLEAGTLVHNVVP
jgi:ribosomal-protein-alanine N-acetyltransferase